MTGRVPAADRDCSADGSTGAIRGGRCELLGGFCAASSGEGELGEPSTDVPVPMGPAAELGG